MFSKAAAKKIRQEFWTLFGKRYPRKWVLYNTKIKDVTLKFTFANNVAQVSIDIEPKEDFLRAYYYDNIISLKSILTSAYLPEAIFDPAYVLDNHKIIARVYVETKNLSINNRNHWEPAMTFLNTQMHLLEAFFIDYKEVIKG